MELGEAHFGWWRRARDAYFADALGEALACIERYRESEDDHSVGVYLHHKIFVKLQRFDDAGALVARMARWKRKAEIAYVIAAFFDARHELANAEQWYRKGIKVEPTSTVGFVLLGEFYARRGRLAEAEATHRHAATLAGHPDEAFKNLAIVLRATGRLEEALVAARRAAAASVIDDLERAIALRDGPSANWWACAAEAWADRARIGEALVAIERHRRAEPASEPGILLAAEILTDLCRFDEAWTLLARLGRRRRAVADAIVRHLRLRGDLACVEEWLTRRCLEEPHAIRGFVELGAVYADQGRLREAEAAYRHATTLDGGDRGDAVLQLGLALRAQGRFEDARDVLVRAPVELAAKILADVERAIDRASGTPP